jgi:undecaprenyl diphosphate synthase
MALKTDLTAQPAATVAAERGVPAHVAIIMDGNGRWAARRGLPRVAGHRRGVEAVRRTVRSAIELGVRYLTIYSFSAENWRRPPQEVSDLMRTSTPTTSRSASSASAPASPQTCAGSSTRPRR